MVDQGGINSPSANQDPCVVSRFSVEGFWKSRSVDCQFFEDVNFLIGPNGSGKTTIVNLLAAALTADFRILDKIQFSTLRVDLVSASTGEGRYQIIASKGGDIDSPIAPIRYAVRDSQGAIVTEFSLDEIEEQLSLRDPRYYSRRRAALRSRVLGDVLRNFVDVTWLSVNRHEGYLNDRPESSVESLVDLKLDSQANQLVRFFSKLEQKSADVLNSFQQSVFLSLLLGHEKSFSIWDEVELDVDAERKRLRPVLEQFGVQRSRFSSKIERHLDTLSSATQKVAAGDGLSDAEVVALVNQRRITEVVSEWQNYLEKRGQIFRLRDAFIRILNSMLLNKEVFITPANELALRTKSGGLLPVKGLSSGEKQLLIILGQALLQDSRPAVYIADEPELSLHVAWQEQIVKNIREINPFAQIIFATHSPDIVGPYQDRIKVAAGLFSQ